MAVIKRLAIEALKGRFEEALIWWHNQRSGSLPKPEREDSSFLLALTTNLYRSDVTADSPENFIDLDMVGSVRIYGDWEFKGKRFIEAPDTSYQTSIVLPQYWEAKQEARPTCYFIRTTFRGHAAQYTRLILPFGYRGRPTHFTALSEVDYFIPADLPLAEKLSPREKECLLLLAAGHGSKNIAYELGVSQKTVEFHIAGIKRKLRAKNTAHAVAIGMLQGLLKGEGQE